MRRLAEKTPPPSPREREGGLQEVPLRYGIQRSAVAQMLLHGTFPVAQLISAIRQGLPFKELIELQASLGVPLEKLASTLGISKATLNRRRLQGHLSGEESDRLVRFARLTGKAIEVCESGENARRWLNSPQVGLGGAVPLEYAETEVGAREVEDLLGRIEMGVYA